MIKNIEDVLPERVAMESSGGRETGTLCRYSYFNMGVV